MIRNIAENSLGDILNALSENNGPRSSPGILIDIIDRIGNYIGEFVEIIEDSSRD